MTPNRNFFQIFLSDGDAAAPPAAMDCVETVRQNAADYEHHLLNGERLRAIIAAEFPERVLAAYDRLTPYAYKADLGRYCLLHRFGGWYADMGVTMRMKLGPLPGTHHILFKDAPRPLQQAWETSNSLIYAPAGSLIMQGAIDLVVSNCEARNYGVSALDPTGPGALGRAVASHGPDASIITGMYLPLTPLHPIKNLAFVLPDGRIMAFGKLNAGAAEGVGDGLKGLGAEGTNSYKILYDARRIYAD